MRSLALVVAAVLSLQTVGCRTRPASEADARARHEKTPLPETSHTVSEPVPEQLIKLERASDDVTFSQFEQANADLLKAQHEAYTANPKLRRYEAYREVPSQWLSHNYNDELNAVIQFDRARGQAIRQTLNDLRTLYALAVTAELSSNAAFAELLFSASEPLAAVFGRGAGSGGGRKETFTLADKLIKWPSEARRNEPLTIDLWRAEHERRYRRCMKAIANIARTNEVPASVLEGIKAKAVYSTMTTAVDVYIQLHTPAALSDARKRQHRLFLTLVNSGYKARDK